MTEAAAAAAVERHPLDEAAGCRMVVRNGVLDKGLSDLSSLPDGVFVGRLADAPAEASAQLVRASAPLHKATQASECTVADMSRVPATVLYPLSHSLILPHRHRYHPAHVLWPHTS